MNDEPSSSAAPPPPRIVDDEVETPGRPLTAAETAERRKKNRDGFNRKRGDLLDDLLRSLDILVYAELSVIYAME